MQVILPLAIAGDHPCWFTVSRSILLHHPPSGQLLFRLQGWSYAPCPPLLTALRSTGQLCVACFFHRVLILTHSGDSCLCSRLVWAACALLACRPDQGALAVRQRAVDHYHMGLISYLLLPLSGCLQLPGVTLHLGQAWHLSSQGP